MKNDDDEVDAAWTWDAHLVVTKRSRRHVAMVANQLAHNLGRRLALVAVDVRKRPLGRESLRVESHPLLGLLVHHVVGGDQRQMIGQVKGLRRRMIYVS